MDITDWFRKGSIQVHKKAIPVKFEVAMSNGHIDTLEGIMNYEIGHKIMIGPLGEKYPLSNEVFHTYYEIFKEDTAIPKKIVKLAKLADHDGMITTVWGCLEYKAEEHFIIQHGPDNFGPVRVDIFFKTYEQIIM